MQLNLALATSLLAATSVFSSPVEERQNTIAIQIFDQGSGTGQSSNLNLRPGSCRKFYYTVFYTYGRLPLYTRITNLKYRKPPAEFQE